MPIACGSWRRAWRKVGKTEVDMEMKTEVVKENRRRGKRKKRRKRTTMIKFNKPHLAGGEIKIQFICLINIKINNNYDINLFF